MTDLDELLSDYVESRVPESVPDFGAVQARARQRRRTRIVAVTAAAAVVVAVASVAGGGLLSDRDSDVPALAAQPAPRDTRPHLSGALPGNELASCAHSYSPRQVADEPFAFDGTVTRMREHPRFGDEAVTFAVNEWFRGGIEATVTVDMGPPGPRVRMSEYPLAGRSYGVGTRLLVSGYPRWGGPPLRHAVATGCGLTRYYDPNTAGAWRSATRWPDRPASPR